MVRVKRGNIYTYSLVPNPVNDRRRQRRQTRRSGGRSNVLELGLKQNIKVSIRVKAERRSTLFIFIHAVVEGSLRTAICSE